MRAADRARRAADRARRAAILLTAAGLMVGLALGPAAAAPPRAASRAVFRLSDPRIDEASGIAAGIRSPRIVYVQNDSGDTDRVFALDRRTGRTAAVVTVAGARNVDWEDIAVAPDAAGTPSLWIADIGDNGFDRAQVQLYRVDEPVVAPGQDRAVVTPPADVWRFRYASGAANAESLAIAPGDVPYVLTKSVLGRSDLYRLPARPTGSAVRTLSPVASVAFAPTGTPDPFGVAGELTATGAAVSSDGALLAVRTYSDVWVWRVHGGDLAAAVRTAPTVRALPTQPQGEGVAFDGKQLLIDSEHAGSAVYAVTLPAALTAPAPARSIAPSAAPTSSATSSAASSTAPSAASSTAPSAASVTTTSSSGGGPDWPLIVVFAAVVAAIAGACGLNRVRFRRRSRRG